MEHKAHLLANMDFNNLAIALKSGSETFPKRTPAQFETFLKAVHNVLVIGEKGGVSDVHGRRMFDVYHGALDAAKARLGPKGVRFAESRMGKLKLDLSDQGSTPMQGQVGRDQGGKSAADTVQAGWFNNEGWVSDAHKNLPGFALLYKEFPEAEWFLMIDDDSYVFVENLHKYLKQFNPDKKYYMGQANKFQGCDDVAVMGMGPPIAQGGTGILMSRGAIKALLKIVDQCTVQYQECWG
ncbi:hypothetical protein HDU79_009014 [Rhizoclosmatium sp. JEL0117]|nr:hypothetical protein HDU79_009014 [Rhizoclosmatium sp. JEL0117]